MVGGSLVDLAASSRAATPGCESGMTISSATACTMMTLEGPSRSLSGPRFRSATSFGTSNVRPPKLGVLPLVLAWGHSVRKCASLPQMEHSLLFPSFPMGLSADS